MDITISVNSRAAYSLVNAIDLVEYDVEFKKIPDDIRDSLYDIMDIAYCRIADLLEDVNEQNVNP